MRTVGRAKDLAFAKHKRNLCFVKRDDYISGPHHFWIHFWCGLVVGAGLGVRISWALFDSAWAIITLTTMAALTFAFCCGRWGDSAWGFLMEFF
jgi:hypothetical protein